MKKTKCEFCKGKGYIFEQKDLSGDNYDDLDNKEFSNKRPIVIPAMLIIAVAIAAFGAYVIYGVDMINNPVEDLVVGDISIVSMANDYSNYYIVIVNPFSKDLTIESVTIGDKSYIGDYYIPRETTTAIVVPWKFPIEKGKSVVVTVRGKDKDGMRVAKVDYKNS
jgi:hypothetical protein